MSTEANITLAEKQSGKALEAAEQLKVETQEDYEKASAMLANIKTAVKLIKAEADKVLVPAKQVVKEETARWKPFIDRAELAETEVKQKMLAYVNETERKAKEEEEKIQAKLAAEKIKPQTALKQAEKIVQAPKQVVAATGGGSQVRKTRVVHIMDASLVPDEYWIINEIVVRRQALAGVEIPGVVVREENSIAGISR